MEQLNQELVIILPEGMENMPVRVVCNDKTTEVMVRIINRPVNKTTCLESGKLHTAIYHQDRYEHVPMNEIQWVEANGSYCNVYTVKDRKITLSYPLKQIQDALPGHVFIRIHRSYLVNIDHIRYIAGNCVVVGSKFLKIGREYHKDLLEKFVFLGVRHKPKNKIK